MTNLEEKVLETIKKYNLINNGDKIVLGVSGGPDSICMLDILIKLKNKLDFEIFVAHVNHMIREEAISDEKFVQDFCVINEIPFYVKRINIPEISKIQKIGEEEAGRNARYDFFEEVLKKVSANKIAIAHNKNDKIETIIMNLLRGSGLSGLKGIVPIRDNKIIRPIIDCERFEIEEYCKINNLNPRIDKTNFENEYTRNKIRNIVIPYIQKEFNPNILKTIKRLSDLATEECDYIENQTEKIYRKLLLKKEKDEIILKLKEFNIEDKVIKSKIILKAISEVIGSTQGIEKIHIDDIIKLCSNNIGNKFLTPNKNLKILIKDKKIYIRKNY